LSVKRDKGNYKVLYNALSELEKKQCKVGWFESIKYEDGTSVGGVMAVQEFGSPTQNIPPRPHCRPTVDRQQNIWAGLALAGSKAVLAGKRNALQVLDALGLKAQEDWALTITQIFNPPLKPATIAARVRRRANKKMIGNLTKPLEDTGYALATLSHVAGDAE